jgi:hypothetical protein
MAIRLGFCNAKSSRQDPGLTELQKKPEFRQLIEHHGIPYVLKL